MSTWLITGCSTGLGRALAEAALAAGENVVATARDEDSVRDLADRHPDTALALALDVTDHARGAAVVARAQDRFGGVDVLVNNAGYGYRAAVEEGEDDAVARLFATNVFGAVALTQAVLPQMRERGTGTVVNISSIGARVSPAGSGYYAATKAALEAITLSLRREIEPLGLTAMAVEPGAFRTDFAGRSLAQAATPIGDYAQTAGLRRKENDTIDGTQQGDPALAARAIIAAVQSPDTPFMLALGPDALDLFRAALDALGADLDAWESTSRGTSFAQ